MKQKDLTEAPLTKSKIAPVKKNKQPTVGPEGRPTVEPYGYVEPSQLVSGEKSAIKLEQAQDLLADVDGEIRKLQYTLGFLSQAPAYQDQLEIVQGFMNNLKEVESKLKARIDELNKIAEIFPLPIKQLFKHIEKNCSRYLKDVRKSKSFLYRGANGPPAYVAKSWDDRKPKDSKKGAQQLFDRLLAQQGFVALRSNSIFTTSDFSRASGYGGRPYVIFPIDNQSHFTYTNQADLTLNNIYEIPVDRKLADPWMKKFLEWLKKENQQLTADGKHDYLINTRLSSVVNILSLKEGDPSWEIYKLLVLDKQEFLAKGAPPELMKTKYTSLVSVESFNNVFKPSQTNLARALQDQVEVYVSGTYYALSYHEYNKWLRIYFKEITLGNI